MVNFVEEQRKSIILYDEKNKEIIMNDQFTKDVKSEAIEFGGFEE